MMMALWRLCPRNLPKKDMTSTTGSPAHRMLSCFLHACQNVTRTFDHELPCMYIRLRRYVNNVKKSSVEVREMWDGTAAQRSLFARIATSLCDVMITWVFTQEVTWRNSCWKPTVISPNLSWKWSDGMSLDVLLKQSSKMSRSSSWWQRRISGLSLCLRTCLFPWCPWCCGLMLSTM